MSKLKVFPIQARWFLLLWFTPMFWSPMELVVDTYLASKWASVSTESSIPIYVFDLSPYYFNGAITILVIALLALITRTSLKPFLSPFPAKQIIPSLEITLFTFFASGALIYLMFFPMSFVIPSFVDSWLINIAPIIYVQDGVLLFWPNFWSWVSLAVLAPVTEELIFRGMLLQRWGSKYNSKVAILLSSAVFASMHTDPLGAFIFGLFMCYLAIRSKGILLPMICHSLYNTLVWTISFVEHAIDPYAIYTLAEFQNDWLYGIAYIAISIVWGVRLHARIPKIEDWKIPVLYKR